MIHKELAATRIKHDINDVEKVLNLLDNVFQIPFEELSRLTSLSAGIEATEEIKHDLREPKSKGKAACIEFIQERFGSEATLGFFDPIKN